MLEEVADLEVRLVADRDELAEADTHVVGAVEDREQDGAALAHDADRAAIELVDLEHARGGERHTVQHVDEAEAVRPDEPHAGAAAELGE